MTIDWRYTVEENLGILSVDVDPSAPFLDAGSVLPVPQARMGRMFLTSGRVRCAEVRPVGPCFCTGEGAAR
ncbi:hypothetical protein ACWEWG_35090 [Streptomyces sp. NPDC003758]